MQKTCFYWDLLREPEKDLSLTQRKFEGIGFLNCNQLLHENIHFYWDEWKRIKLKKKFKQKSNGFWCFMMQDWYTEAVFLTAVVYNICKIYFPTQGKPGAILWTAYANHPSTLLPFCSHVWDHCTRRGKWVNHFKLLPWSRIFHTLSHIFITFTLGYSY